MKTSTGQVLYADHNFKDTSRLMLVDMRSKQVFTVYLFLVNYLSILMLLVLPGALLLFWKKAKRTKSIVASVAALVLAVVASPCFAQTQSANCDTTSTLQNRFIKKSKTVLFPAISYAPETNLALGLSAMHFYKTSENARLSQISGNMLYTFNHQFINEVNMLHYSHGSSYLVKAGLAFNKYPEKFYGIGNKTTETNAVTITYNAVKADLSLLKKVEKNTYTGIHYKFARHYHLYQGSAVSFILDTLTGGDGSVQSGFGAELLYDSRDNSSNSTKGWYAFFDATWNNQLLGSTSDYFSIDADIRKYHIVHAGAVVALQGIIQIKEGLVPFTHLSYLGGGNMMRGFYSGRFRDNDLMALQAEYRRHLWRNWGFVLFAGAGEVSNNLSQINSEYLRHSFGFGLRRSISKQHKVNLRLDVGYGNGQCNFYVNIGEAF